MAFAGLLNIRVPLVADSVRVCARRRFAVSPALLLSKEPVATEDEDQNEDGLERALFNVTEEESKIRFDKVLAARFPDVSRNYVGGLFGTDSVLVDGSQLRKKSAKVKVGSTVEVAFKEPADRSLLVPNDIPLDVVYEDDDILVVNKKPGMVVHPAPGNWEGTLVNALAFRYKENFIQQEEAGVRPGIVHRLDKGTSGLLVVARTPLALRRLVEQFRQREVQKTYLAISARNPLDRGTLTKRVELPIGRHPQIRTRMAVVSEELGGRSASSVFSFIGSDQSNMATLLQIYLETGRTHQIRVHLNALHSPVLGDDLYGYDTFNSKYRSTVTRPLLHAFRLELNHPTSGERMSFEAEMPEDMLTFVQKRIIPDFAERKHEIFEDP